MAWSAGHTLLLASPAMWMNPEDARTDAILAGAVAVFGGFAIGLLTEVPLFPRGGIVGALIGVVFLFALTGLVPQLLSRHRQLGPESYGLGEHSHGWRSGLVLAAPVVVAGLLRGVTQAGASPGASLLGRLSGLYTSDPTVSDSAQSVAAVEIALQSLIWITLAVGMLLLYTFMTVRGRDAFARNDLDATEAVRTFGMGAVAAAFVFGGLLALTADAITFVSVLINVLALLALVLAADRIVPPGAGTTRGAMLAPLILAAVLHVFGARSGNLLLNLYAAALAAGIAVVIGAVIEGRTHARAVLPLVAAVALYPSCLSPLAFDLGRLPC